MTAPALQFVPCDGAFGARSHGVPVECADARVPRDWRAPAGSTLSLRVERIVPAAGAPVRAQIWMLQGGPGASSLAFERSLAPLVASRIDGAEILLVDHRGVGGSDRLACPSEEATFSPGGTLVVGDEVPACLRYVRDSVSAERLETLSTTSAAHDLGALIELARRPGVPVFVYGVSYGTYWAQRHLALYPDQADGVILDSICAPTTCRVPLQVLEHTESIGLALLAACAADATCSTRFGPDPAERYRALLDRLDAGHCPDARAHGLDRQGVRAIAGALLQSFSLRQAIPALLARLDRCAPEDLPALQWIATTLLSPGADGGETERMLWSTASHFLVRRSELWESPTPAWDDIVAASADDLFWPRMREDVYTQWADGARYAPDEMVGRFADTEVPMLMMSGTLDPQTSPADALPVRERYTAPGQTFVEIERAAHGVLTQSPYERRDPQRTCGMDLLHAFVSDPRAPLDTSCRTETAALDFDAADIAPIVFGTAEMWGAAPARVTLDAHAMRELEQVREALRVVR